MSLTLPQVFFKHFTSKNQLPGFYISGTFLDISYCPFIYFELNSLKVCIISATCDILPTKFISTANHHAYESIQKVILKKENKIKTKNIIHLFKRKSVKRLSVFQY